jgi:hypothetical protein
LRGILDSFNLSDETMRAEFGDFKSKEFSIGCGTEDCDWCNFTKDWMKGKELLAAPNTIEEEE